MTTTFYANILQVFGCKPCENNVILFYLLNDTNNINIAI